MTSVSQYSYRLDPSSNEFLSEALEKRVFGLLDFDPRDVALAKLPRKLELKLQAEINSILGDHVDAAFTLGWEAASNPAAWLFDSDGLLTLESPSNIYSEKMRKLGLGSEDIFNDDGELPDAVAVLFSRAEEMAFALGWDLQHNPDSLVFQVHTPDNE